VSAIVVTSIGVGETDHNIAHRRGYNPLAIRSHRGRRLSATRSSTWSHRTVTTAPDETWSERRKCWMGPILSRSSAPVTLADNGGAGGARTHDPRIMSRLGAVRLVPDSAI